MTKSNLKRISYDAISVMSMLLCYRNGVTKLTPQIFHLIRPRCPLTFHFNHLKLHDLAESCLLQTE